MDWLGMPDWGEVLLPSVPLLELVVRGTLLYLGLFVLLRFVLKREAGTMSITDLLLIVLLADAAQNAMAGEYRSVSDGMALVGTLVFWNYALDWLAFRFPRVRDFVRPPELQLVRDGQILRRNMRRELITEEELRSQLREQGVDDVAKVKAAYIEGDGRFSVVTYDEVRRPKTPERPAG